MTLSRYAGWLAAVFAVGYLGVWAVPFRTGAGKPDLNAFAALPVQDGGRLKPIDTLAQTTLTAINSRQTFVHDRAEYGEKSYPSVEWLLETWGAGPGGPTAEYPVFRITDLQLVDYFGLKQRPGFWRYSLAELAGRFGRFNDDLDRVQQLARQDSDKLTPFDHALLDLGRHMNLYLRLANRQDPQAVPPQDDGEGWRTVADIEHEAAKGSEQEMQARAVMAALQEVKPGAKPDDLKTLTPEQADKVRETAFDLFRRAMAAVGEQKRAAASPAAEAFANLFRLYREKKYDEFNAAVAAYKSDYLGHVPADALQRVRFEAVLNRAAPVFHSMILYVTAFVFACLSWVLAGLRLDAAAVGLRRAALGLAAATAVVHFGVLIGRMYLMDRWLVFVTNLYSSAV
ncbi:MAG TPA: hypothetical protein VGF55_28880, partial [Gemmataceae bacterium]